MREMITIGQLEREFIEAIKDFENYDNILQTNEEFVEKVVSANEHSDDKLLDIIEEYSDYIEDDEDFSIEGKFHDVLIGLAYRSLYTYLEHLVQDEWVYRIFRLKYRFD